MAQSGVYAIQNLLTGRTYIGSSVCMRRRWNEHRSKLRNGIHPSRALQVDWNGYGETSFVFVVLERIEDEELRHDAEQTHIDRLEMPYNENLRAGSGPKAGFTPSAETRRKLSLAHRGKVVSAETRARISAAHKGKKLSEEHKRSIGLARLGHRHTEETKQKQREATAKLTRWWGSLISAAKKGRKVPALSAAKKGKPWSEARRRAFELSRLG